MVLLLAVLSFCQGLMLWAQYYLVQEAANAHQPQ